MFLILEVHEVEVHRLVGRTNHPSTPCFQICQSKLQTQNRILSQHFFKIWDFSATVLWFLTSKNIISRWFRLWPFYLLVGGDLPLKGSRFHHPKKVTTVAELPGCADFSRGLLQKTTLPRLSKTLIRQSLHWWIFFESTPFPPIVMGIPLWTNQYFNVFHGMCVFFLSQTFSTAIESVTNHQVTWMAY